MTKDIFLIRLNDNHISSLTGWMGRGVTIVIFICVNLNNLRHLCAFKTAPRR